MNKILILYDTPVSHRQFMPITFTRPVGTLRAGFVTLQEWWAMLTHLPVYCLSHQFISDFIPDADLYLCVDATVAPAAERAAQIANMTSGSMLEDEEGIIAFAQSSKPYYQQMPVWVENSQRVANTTRITHCLELVQNLIPWMKEQFPLLKSSLVNVDPPAGVWVNGDKENLVVEEGADLESAIIDVRHGPVVIRKNALIMHGSILRGPVYIGQGAVAKMGAHLYGGTVIGDACTAGGEIKNSVLHAYTNKAHHGYLGDSYIGAWCNWGAGTNNSNVKNSAWPIRVWDYEANGFRQFGEKVGCLMGDFTRTAINSSINSGTVTGVCCSIHFEGLTSKIIPSFSFGQTARYQWEKALRDINNWKKFRNSSLDERETENLLAIYEKRELDKYHEE